MKIKFNEPKTINSTYEVPEGNYLCEITSVNEYSSGPNALRITFKVISPRPEDQLFLLGKSYGGDSAIKEAQMDIRAMLGIDLEDLLNEDRELDVQLLVGKQADIRVTHVFTRSHSKPFVKVALIARPGSLTDPPKNSQPETASKPAYAQI